MTNAQLHADNAVKTKLEKIDPALAVEPKKEFKLKRFQNVDARTSTKRTDTGFATKPNAAQNKAETLQ